MRNPQPHLQGLDNDNVLVAILERVTPFCLDRPRSIFTSLAGIGPDGPRSNVCSSTSSQTSQAINKT